jgi:hypothetical protein
VAGLRCCRWEDEKPLAGDALALEEEERPIEEGRDGGGPLVRMELDEASREWSPTMAWA